LADDEPHGNDDADEEPHDDNDGRRRDAGRENPLIQRTSAQVIERSQDGEDFRAYPTKVACLIEKDSGLVLCLPGGCFHNSCMNTGSFLSLLVGQPSFRL